MRAADDETARPSVTTLREAGRVRADAYDGVLGVAPDATQAEIRAAYRQLGQKVHPDAGGTDALLRQIQVAYETLSDPDRRTAYDRHLAGDGAGGADGSRGDGGAGEGWGGWGGDDEPGGRSHDGPGAGTRGTRPDEACLSRARPPPPARAGCSPGSRGIQRAAPSCSGW